MRNQSLGVGASHVISKKKKLTFYIEVIDILDDIGYRRKCIPHIYLHLALYYLSYALLQSFTMR